MIRRMTEKDINEDVPRCRGWLQAIAQRSNCSYAGIVAEWDEHDKLAYCIGEEVTGIILAQVRGTTYSVSGTAGVCDGDWETVAAELSAIAQLKGCTHLEMRGRRGFLRLFKRYGWEESFTVINKEI